MVRVAVSQWMEFNIKNAAKAWKNKEHNLGISIQVIIIYNIIYKYFNNNVKIRILN